MEPDPDPRWSYWIIGAIAVSIVWVIAWLGVAALSEPTLWDMKLNEAADFWAGMAAPLAFFWLVLGFFQQGRELNESVKQFERQSNIMQSQFDVLISDRSQESIFRQLEALKFDLIDIIAPIVSRTSTVIGGIKISEPIIRTEEFQNLDFASVSKLIVSRLGPLERRGLIIRSNISREVIVRAANRLDPIIAELDSIGEEASSKNLEKMVLEFKSADFDGLKATLTKHFDLKRV
ncbi:hypothetical protein [Hyphomonas oceanitis]|uniref:Uncharacterized protein n=1 Tax=Hyphomonas oceanitis SCH89 TaxID=1280953 RepID=A0A059G6A1_9PROT|nr:hypothetical protein [Hyphomonas oceanitis]KDA02336.1 hypothetical protein HOC_11268 [Hyphomonas oceanitis SCH89]